MSFLEKIRHAFFGIKSVDEFLDIAKRNDAAEVDLLIKESHDKYGYSCDVKLKFKGYEFDHMVFRTTDTKKIKERKLSALQEAMKISDSIKSRGMIPNTKFIGYDKDIQYLDNGKINSIMAQLRS